MYDYDDFDSAPEPEVCRCRGCRSEGFYDSGPDCLWANGRMMRGPDV